MYLPTYTVRKSPAHWQPSVAMAVHPAPLLKTLQHQ